MNRPEHRLRFAYSTINWGVACDIPAALADIRNAGWGAVELFGHSLDILGTPASLTAELKGLAPATLFAGIEFPDSPIQRTKLRNHARFASEIGAEAFGLVGGARLRWRPPAHEEYAELAALCEDLALFGESLGVMVSYHPHVACTIETSEEIEVLMRQTKHLKLCLDASHIALVGEDPLTVLETWWDRLGYIHLKDWGKGKFAELGRGTIDIDFPKILDELARWRFEGWVVLEQSQSDVSPLESARINAAYLRGLGYDIG
ncbi:MAG: sugar phosphate isomerase/epimerase [Chloroflexota bacterium]|nr:sugar phosphate isomerase/epimerase [Chloroflexota bacterium]